MFILLFISVALLLAKNSVYSETYFQAKACAVEDFQCNAKATEDFLDKTASGIAALDIKPYDPLIIDSFDSNTHIHGVLAKFKNINIIGLRKQTVTELRFDTVKKSTFIAVVVHVNILSDIEVKHEKTKKKYYGTYTASGKAAIRATYDYQLKADNKGVIHYISGPETLTCDFITFHGESKEIMNAVENSPRARKVYLEQRAFFHTIHKREVCEILKAAYAVILNAARKVEGAYPVSAFVSDEL